MTRRPITRPRALLLSVLSVLALSGTTAAAAVPVTCGPPFPTRHAWAQLLGSDGHALWTVPLASVQASGTGALQPLVGPHADFLSADGWLTAVSPSMGHRLWRVKPSPFLTGLWLWQDTVVVLSADGLDAHQTFTGYDAATGKQRWQRLMPGFGVYNTQPQTSDGGLAVIRQDGVLEVLDLATGNVRWSVREEKSLFQLQVQSPTAATVGGAVLFTANGRLTAYDQRTGRQLWNAVHLPGHPLLMTGSSTVAVVFGQVKSAASPSVVVGIDLATGRERWRFLPKREVSTVAVGERGVLVASAHYPDYRDWFLDAASGKQLWHVDQQLEGVSPVVAGDDVVLVQHSYAKRYSPVTLIDREATTGRVRWQVGLHGAAAGVSAVAVTDGVLTTVAQTVAAHPKSLLSAYAISSGHKLWTSTLRAAAQLPTQTPDGLLVTEDDPANSCPA